MPSHDSLTPNRNKTSHKCIVIQYAENKRLSNERTFSSVLSLFALDLQLHFHFHWNKFHQYLFLSRIVENLYRTMSRKLCTEQIGSLKKSTSRNSKCKR